MKAYRRGADGQWHVINAALSRLLRTWIVWADGWEKRAGGWEMTGAPWPIALFGQRIVLKDDFLSVELGRIGGGTLVAHYKVKGKPWRGFDAVFITSCGQPSPHHLCTHTWLVGTPAAIVKSVTDRPVA